jgi:hypothetical protein
LIQSDLADEPAEARREHLADVVERAVAKLSPAERETFLTELEGAFPSWDANVQIAEGPQAQPVKSAMDEKELRDPSFLVARLAELAPSLTDVQRRLLTDRLREAGLAPKPTGPAWPDDAAEKFRARIQAKSADLDAGRVLETATILAEFATSLDQLIWNTWKTVAPRSALRRPAALAQTMGRFVSGDAEVGRGQVAQDTERLRQLTAALVSAVSQVGRQFAQSLVARLSPTEITALANMEAGGLLVSKEVKCWRKYVELAGSLDETAIEQEIMQALAGYAESLMKGVGGRG